MTISYNDQKMLFQRSGNRCAYPDCNKLLTFPETAVDGGGTVSEVAHIVAQRPDGPRGGYPLPPSERDKYDNLILLCEEDHHRVDKQVHYFTVERLRQMKCDHERFIEKATDKDRVSKHARPPKTPYVSEMIYSTLLPVQTMPRYIYNVACDLNDVQEKDVQKEILLDGTKHEMAPFIVRGKHIYCFQDMKLSKGPFRRLAHGRIVRREGLSEWVDDPDRSRWLAALLKRSLNKLTGRKALRWDREHNRYYFIPCEKGQPLEISYRPMNQETARRQVVWQPITKKTNIPKNFWYHRAVHLVFLRISARDWCLGIRPEMHITKDGETPLDHSLVGRKVTRKTSRMFNYDLLAEFNFWRDFLCGSRPRIIFHFGPDRQQVIVSATMLSAKIVWPGIPPEHQKPFRNISYEDDLFSLAELRDIEEDDDGDDEVFEFEDEA